MNPFAIAFVFAIGTLILTVSRKWAPVPLLAGCLYMTMGQGVQLGPASLPAYRIFILLGIVRALSRGEWVQGGFNKIDKLLVTMGIWILIASFFHDGVEGSGPVFASGFIFNILGAYFLVRCWSGNLADLELLIVVIAFLLAPVALEMVSEKITKVNQFSIFGGVPHNVAFREGSFRAQGPFRHPILAGTAGASCIPFFIGIFRRRKFAAMVGLVSATAMTLASASSGPAMTAMAGLAAAAFWKFRHHTKTLRIGAVVGYFAISIYWGEPGYYIMKRIDISGGSTGWHRSRLIESSIEKLDEWWLYGTDYTRHWMHSGVSWSGNHTDITNYYLYIGVISGLAGIALMIWIMVSCFGIVGDHVKMQVKSPHGESKDAFLVWCLGAALFAHCASAVAVSYFDQSLVFFWMTVALVSSLTHFEAEHVELEEIENDDHAGKGTHVCAPGHLLDSKRIAAASSGT